MRVRVINQFKKPFSSYKDGFCKNTFNGKITPKSLNVSTIINDLACAMYSHKSCMKERSYTLPKTDNRSFSLRLSGVNRRYRCK